MTRPNLDGRGVAIICAGTPLDRAIAVAFAESGASIGLATLAETQEQEFAIASIANEVWAVGHDQLTRVMDATDPAAVASFQLEVLDRLGRCDILICGHDEPSFVQVEELSAEDWEDILLRNLTAPFLASQAFGRAMERDGGGTIVLITYDRPDGDAAYRAAKAGLSGLAAGLAGPLGRRGVHVAVVEADERDLTSCVARVIGAAANQG